MLREILTRYGRENLGFLWLFVEPMMFTLGITLLWNIIGTHKTGGITVTEFVLVGYSTILLWRNMPNRCIGALSPNFSLMFHRQVKPIDIYVSRLLLEIFGATTSLVVLCIAFHAFGSTRLPYDYLLMACGWALLAWFAAAISLIAGAIGEKLEYFDRLFHTAQYLFVPLSGAFFMVSALPAKLRDVVLYIPPVHCSEMLRAGFFGPEFIWYYSVIFVVASNMVLTLLGLALVRGINTNPAT